jgi:general secretion pathway protein C
MELFFRKYFWVVNLAFLLLAALLAAETVNVFVGGKLAPSAAPEQTSAQAAPPSRAEPKRSLTPEALSKVTGIELPPPVDENASQEAPTPNIEGQEAVKSGLRARVLATVVANRPDWSMANIEDQSSKEVKLCMVGDTVMNAEILEIEWLRVIINNGGRKEYLDTEPGDGSGAPQPPGPRGSMPPVAMNVNPPPSADVGGGIKSLGGDNYEIEKGEIDKALSNLNDIAMQARIVPAFKDGAATGFKLFSIRPNSLYSKIGIQNGDVIRRINGYEINSPDKALEIYTKLRESNRIDIELDRNGSPVRKTYNVR